VSEIVAGGLGKANVRLTKSGPGEHPDGQKAGVHRWLPASDQGLTPSFLFNVAAVFDEAEDLLVGRHKDYGPGNIANAYPDPLTAIVVRMGDKMERIKHLLTKNGDTYGESLRDSWLDLANYALIGILVQDKKWPGIK